MIHVTVKAYTQQNEFKSPYLRYCFYVSTSGSVLNSWKFKLFLAGAFPFLIRRSEYEFIPIIHITKYYKLYIELQPTKHVCAVSMAGCQTKIINMKMYWIKSPAPLVRNAIKHSSYESHMCTFFGSLRF